MDVSPWSEETRYSPGLVVLMHGWHTPASPVNGRPARRACSGDGARIVCCRWRILLYCIQVFDSQRMASLSWVVVNALGGGFCVLSTGRGKPLTRRTDRAHGGEPEVFSVHYFLRRGERRGLRILSTADVR